MNWDFVYRGETDSLDETSRRELGGAFARLSAGYTHYELAGPGEGRAVILVHGFSAASFIWDPTWAALSSAGLRVLRYDLFGRGYSDRPPVPNNLALFVQQLRELLDSLSIAEVDLVGLSMGGPIAAGFATRYPRRVRRVALIDPVGPDPVPLRPIYRLALLPGIAELLLGLSGSGGVARGAATDFFGPAPVHEFEQVYLRQMRFKGFKRSLLSSVRHGMIGGFPQVYERLGQEGKPVLLIWGTFDRAVPIQQSTRLCALVPQAEFHAIDGCSHTPHYEKPSVVNPMLLEFLLRP